jgi:hypothetical protein
MMKLLTSSAIVALTAGIVGFAGMTPAAYAQQQPRHDQQQNLDGPKDHRPGAKRELRGGMGMMGRPGLLNVVCSEDGADRLEIAFLRFSQRIDPTAEQMALFDDLKSTALAAQAEFAKTCAAVRPAATAEADAPRDPVAGLKARLAIEKAHIAAIETVLPKFEALLASLTDAQKAAMTPQRQARNGGQHRPGDMQQNDMPAPPAGEPGAIEPAPGDLQG